MYLTENIYLLEKLHLDISYGAVSYESNVNETTILKKMSLNINTHKTRLYFHQLRKM